MSPKGDVGPAALLVDIGDRKFHFGAGCGLYYPGYRGRTGLFEMIKVTDAFREMVNSGAATLVLRQKAIEQGMHLRKMDSQFSMESTAEEVLNIPNFAQGKPCLIFNM